MPLESQSGSSRMTTQPDKPAVASYTPEEQVFHRLFPQVPLSEKLVESRQCAFMSKKKKFARMGTLYASSLRICFSSSFLKEPVMVRWEDVASVEKGTSFLFEAIVMKLKNGEEFIFSGFLSGGAAQTFKLLKTLWTVRARYAFSDALVSTSTGVSPLAPDAASVHSSDVSSGVCEDLDEKQEGDLSRSSSASSLKPAPAEGISCNPLSEDMTGDSDTIGRIDWKPDIEEKVRNHVNTPKLLSVQDPASDKFEWLQYFPNIPKSELLVDYFQCSYVSGVHRLGKLYITTNYVLFSSVMMGEGLQISFKDVRSIEKEQTMMILDGIGIKLNNGNIYSFTSFVSRDAAFNILTHFFTVMKTLSPPIQSPLLANEKNDVNTGFVSKTSESDVTKFPVVDSLNEFSKVLTDYGAALSDYTCFKRELMEPITLPEGKTVVDVFKLCFDDDSSLLEEYHAGRKDTNQKWEPWRPALEGSPPFCGQRQFTCTTIVKALVAKSCPFTEYQRYAFMNISGNQPTLVVQVSGQVEGVMFTDAFRVEALLVFSQSDSVVTMRAFGHVQFLRDVWVKGKILRTSLDVEMPECYKRLGAMLAERLQYGATTISSEAANQMQPGPPPVSLDAPLRYELCSSGFKWRPALCGELVLESISAIFCMNALFHAYFFTVPARVIGVGNHAGKTDEGPVPASFTGSLVVADVVDSFVVELVRPFLITALIGLLCIVLFSLRRTLGRMR
ncbi:hypothetical protein DQ04_04351020 [Trypanosoma grayi]|uniref:hypothetical protein n=1 Tax=Trypanosoma grayi TaxID=71804 RepID=UPI0004F48CB4|nr:hypothetical protein DQ04_04351020 [Trypanosoma grayi]KEG09979.1 hypothetical protein DQ04_04351020 [Trypanosoma grayi]